MLLSLGIHTALEVEQTRLLEFGGVGDDLDKLITELVVLRFRVALAGGWGAGRRIMGGRTRRIVSMKTLLELERHRKVVVGDKRALTAWTPRFMPGCCTKRAHQLPSPPSKEPTHHRD